MDSLSKTYNEKFIITFDFSDIIESNSINSYSITVYNKSTDVTNTIIYTSSKGNDYINATIYNGEIGLNYIINCIVILSNDTIFEKNVSLNIIDDKYLDLSKFNLSTIKHLNAITDATNDSQINYYIDSIFRNILKHCRQEFLFKNKIIGRVWNDRDVVFIKDKFTIDSSFDLPIEIGDWIKISYSQYNDGYYQIENISNLTYTISNNKYLKDETNTNIKFELIQFPSEFIYPISIFINEILNTENNGKDIKKEKIDDYEIEYFKPNSNKVFDFISQNSVMLNNHRYV